jgi:hypothetical protein
MVSAGLGDDTAFGGTNVVSYYSDGFLPGPTVELDGKLIVEKGVLKVTPK